MLCFTALSVSTLLRCGQEDEGWMVKAVEVRGGRLDVQPAARVDRPHVPLPPLLRLPRLQVKIAAAQR